MRDMVKATYKRFTNLTLSSIYTHFKNIEGKSFLKTLWKKGEIAQNEQFHLFPQCFL